MATIFDYGPGAFFYPTFSSTYGPTNTVGVIGSSTSDALGKDWHFIGHLEIEDRSSNKLLSTLGKLHICFGTSTSLLDVGTVLRVGIQDVDLSLSPPRGDGGWDVYGDETGGFTTIVPSWSTINMGAGGSSKLLSHGDLVSFVFSYQSHEVGDSFNLQYGSISPVGIAFPYYQHFNGGSWVGGNNPPSIVVEFDDGTLGWLRGSFVHSAVTNVGFGNASVPDERGNIIRLPRPALVEGFYFTGTGASSNTVFEIALYSDPFGTPTVERTIAVDNELRVTPTVRFNEQLIANPFELQANTDYAVTIRHPVSSFINLLTVDYFNDSKYLKAVPGGENVRSCFRTDLTGAFSTTSTRRYGVGLVLSGGSSGGSSLALPIGRSI